MKIIIGKLNSEPIEADRIMICIGEERFRITESFGKMTVNKTTDGISDILNVNPRYANEIDIS